jgi:hypothetical protein
MASPFYAWLPLRCRAVYRVVSNMRKNTETGPWFLADVVERSEAVGTDKSNTNRRCLTWVNTLLIQASSLSDAYDKAMIIAKKTYTSRYKAVSGRTIQWTVVGISSLVPVYEELKHGSEISWTDRGYLSAKRSSAMVITKRKLLKDANQPLNARPRAKHAAN